MAIVGRVVGTAAGAEMLTTGARSARGRAFPRMKKRTLMVAVVLLALSAFAALIPASEAPNNAEHYYYYSAGSTNDQSGAAGGPVSQASTPQMSEKEALEAYEKLPLSFIPNKGQTDEEAVRYYAQGAGYGFFFTPGGATLSFAGGKGRGHALALDFLGAGCWGGTW
jgi:hypothetical protein